MTEEIEAVSLANPVHTEELRDLMAIDRRSLLASLNDEHGTDRGQPGSRGRVGFALTGLIAAACLAAIAFFGVRAISEAPSVDESASEMEVVPTTVSNADSSPANGDEPAADGAASSALEAEQTASDNRSSTPTSDTEGTTEAAGASSETVATPTTGQTAETMALGLGLGLDPDIDPADAAFDRNIDLLSVHYDHAPSRDDGHSTVATRELAAWAGITPHVVSGAYGVNGDEYEPASVTVTQAAWGNAWFDAHADWTGTVAATADQWLAAIDQGGSVWVAEGGQSELTADVVREVVARRPDLDTARRIHIVQHSAINEGKTDPDDLRFLRSVTDYRAIDDGNSANNTADLNGPSDLFVAEALSGSYASAWDAAFAYFPSEELDFSDTVAVLHILGLGTDSIDNADDFARVILG